MARSSSFSGGFDETAFRDAWLAGLYEGEGSCSLAAGRLQIQIKMTDEDVIRRVLEVAGVGRVYGPYRRGPDHYKAFWTYIAYKTDDVLVLLDRLRPFLMSRRREQIDTAIAGHAAWRASMPSDVTRFRDKVVHIDGHHLWTGFVAADGYGHVWVDGPRADPTTKRSGRKARLDLAHRVAWRMSGRELKRAVNLRNLCGRRDCVDPEHWIRADQTCTEGHQIEGDNVLLTRNGKYIKRSCRLCHLERNRQARERRRGEKLSV